jgi:hypothetical protein
MGQELFDEVTAVNGRPIPEDQQTAGPLHRTCASKATPSAAWLAGAWH